MLPQVDVDGLAIGASVPPQLLRREANRVRRIEHPPAAVGVNVGQVGGTVHSNDDTPLGAIVYPAVQLELINPVLWPNFPYRKLAPSVDVWMPIAYFTFRNADYPDAFLYSDASVKRLPPGPSRLLAEDHLKRINKAILALANDLTRAAKAARWPSSPRH